MSGPRSFRWIRDLTRTQIVQYAGDFNRFVREVVNIPEVWAIGGFQAQDHSTPSPPSGARDADGGFGGIVFEVMRAEENGP